MAFRAWVYPGMVTLASIRALRRKARGACVEPMLQIEELVPRIQPDRGDDLVVP